MANDNTKTTTVQPPPANVAEDDLRANEQRLEDARNEAIKNHAASIASQPIQPKEQKS